jgi:hypothetical protein
MGREERHGQGQPGFASMDPQRHREITWRGRPLAA